MSMREASANPDALNWELEQAIIEDTDGSLGLDHPLLRVMAYTPDRNVHYNDLFLGKKRALREARRNRDWAKAVWLHERPYRATRMLSIARRTGTTPQLKKLLIDVWIDSENIWQNEGTWRRLFAIVGNGRVVTRNGDRAVWQSLPARLAIFRGFDFDGRERGLSWTLKRQKAEYFARRFGPSEGIPRVALAVCRKGDVLAYTNARKEAEIVVAPESIELLRIIQLGAPASGFRKPGMGNLLSG